MNALWRAVPVVLFALLGSCRPEAPDLSIRLKSDDFAFRVISEPIPPHARETTRYKVTIRDDKTGQPIEGGEGQIFASSADRVNIYDALVAGEELGTYYGNLRFVTAGDWAVAIRFRRDSTHTLQRVDWMQEVLAER